MGVVKYPGLISWKTIYESFRFFSKSSRCWTAFLDGDLKEEIYMEHPPSVRNVTKDDCVILEISLCWIRQILLCSRIKIFSLSCMYNLIICNFTLDAWYLLGCRPFKKWLIILTYVFILYFYICTFSILHHEPSIHKLFLSPSTTEISTWIGSIHHCTHSFTIFQKHHEFSFVSRFQT